MLQQRRRHPLIVRMLDINAHDCTAICRRAFGQEEPRGRESSCSENQCPERSLPKMNIETVKPALLSTSHGKYVCVQGTLRPKRSHRLVAQNEQECNPKNSVKVYDIVYNGTRRCMAFGFELENESVFPVVTHSGEVTFKVLPTDKPITEGNFDETFLFQWGEPEISGAWRSLESVAKPRKYLFVEKKGKVIITEDRMPYFRIRYPDENRDKDLQSLCRSGEIRENVTNSCRKIWRRRNLKRGPSCCEGSEVLTNPLRYPKRKTKKMKMSVKC